MDLRDDIREFLVSRRARITPESGSNSSPAGDDTDRRDTDRRERDLMMITFHVPVRDLG